MRRIALVLFFLTSAPLFSLQAAGTVDLLWQGKTYAPAFYLGRSLWTNQTDIVFAAIPHIPKASGGEVDPSTLIYKWSKDGTVLGSLSGLNKRSLTVSDTLLSKQIRITIDILTEPETEAVASASLSLTPASSELLVYEDNPLYGLMFNRAVSGTFKLTDPEATFSAFPFFSNASSRSGNEVSYTWATNSGDVRTGNKATYRRPENGSGSSNIEVKATNRRLIVLPMLKDFTVQFGNENNL